MANYRNNRARWSNNNYSEKANNFQYKQQPPVKKSGATYTRISKGKYEGLMHVSAWKKSGYTIVKASATPLANKSSESANGKQYIPYLVTVIDMKSLQKSIYNGIMNIQTNVLVIQELGYCITPNGSGTTKSGTRVKGYFGKFTG